MPMAERVSAYRRLAATLRDRSEPLASIIIVKANRNGTPARRELPITHDKVLSACWAD
jgi:hypothetical protein